MKNTLSRLALCVLLSFSAACAPNVAETNEAAAQDVQSIFDREKAWEEFEGYFRLYYAYFNKMDFDVEAALEVTKTRSLQAKDKANFRKEIVIFGHLFADPHIIIGPVTDDDFNVVPTSSDLRIRYVSGNYVVEDVRAGSAADKASIRPGLILISADGQSLEAKVSEIFMGLVDDPTVRQKSHVATLIANGKRSGDRTLTFETVGEITLPNARVYAQALSKKPPLSISYKNDIAVIRVHNSLGNNDMISTFDEAMIKTASAKGIILDLRETSSGGNTEVARSIMGHFVSEPRPYQTHTVPSLEREFTVPRRFTEFVLPRAPYRNPKEAVVLGSYWTGSMGEGIVIGLDGAADMHVIASDMGDLLGGLSNYDLKMSGLRLDIPSETLSHVDGTPRESFVGDLSLSSAERDASGGDPALNAAIAYLRQ